MVETRDDKADDTDSEGGWSDPYGSEGDGPDQAEEYKNITVINSKGYRESDALKLRPEVITTIDEINAFLEVGLDSCIQIAR